MARTSDVVRNFARKLEEESFRVKEDCMIDLTASKRGSMKRK